MSRDCLTCKYSNEEPLQKPCCDCFFDVGNIEFSEYVPAVEEKDELVSHPNHYQSKSGLEVIDVIRTFTEDLTGVESFYTGNILKYMCRWKKKNGMEDLKKARQYLDWLIEIEDPHMTEEDTKRELNRLYGLGIFDDFENFWDSLPDDAKEYAKNLANEEKKEPPKNGRYSVNESDCCSGECECKTKKDDCFVPWQIQPTIEKQEAVEIIWDQFCDAFLNALKEVSKEEKENKKDEK